MKYINLNRNINDESYLSAVLKTGCGPNFIRNRPQLFEAMIKEQGLEFWFRFWLSFCLNHNVTEFHEFEQEVPGWVMAVCQVLHDNFVEVSSKEALRFCWNVILRNKLLSQILSISPAEYKTPLKTKPAFYRQQFAESTSEFVQIAFACALGEIFHKWLNTDENDAGKKYWSVPDRYLEPDFKPGVLEKFLVDKWGIKLAKFFGVGAERLPWVRQMLRYDRGILKYVDDPTLGRPTGPAALIGLPRPLEDRIDTWKSKVKQMRHEIQTVDEGRKNDYGKHLKRLQLRNRDKSISSHSEVLLQSEASGDTSKEKGSTRLKKNGQFSSCTNTCCVNKGRRNNKEIKIGNGKKISSLP